LSTVKSTTGSYRGQHCGVEYTRVPPIVARLRPAPSLKSKRCPASGPGVNLRFDHQPRKLERIEWYLVNELSSCSGNPCVPDSSNLHHRHRQTTTNRRK